MSRGLLIRELPDSERPRERLMEKGPDALKDSELIAILLRTGIKGVSAIQVAEQILLKFDSLDNLSRASVADLRLVKGVGRDKAIALQSAFTLARRMAKELRQEAPTLDTPERIADLLREQNRAYEVENFQVVLLNTRRKLIRLERISKAPWIPYWFIREKFLSRPLPPMRPPSSWRTIIPAAIPRPRKPTLKSRAISSAPASCSKLMCSTM